MVSFFSSSFSSFSSFSSDEENEEKEEEEENEEQEHSINKGNIQQKVDMRIKDLHPCRLGMSQLCYYYINPHVL